MDIIVGIYRDWAGRVPLLAEKTDSAKFETQVHGGFKSFSAALKLPPWEKQANHSFLLGKHLKAFDLYGRSVWEGRVSGLELRDDGIGLTAQGYYADGKSIFHGMIYVEDPLPLYKMVRDCVQLVDTWNDGASVILEDADNNLMHTDPEEGVIPLDFSEEKVTDALEKCLSYGYSNTEPLPAFLTIYEHGIVRLFTTKNLYRRFAANEFNFYVLNRRNIRGRMSSSVDLNEVFNKVYAVYANESDAPSWTEPVENPQSISLYGLREGLVQNGGNPEGLAMAESLRDYALETYAYPRVTVQVTATGAVESKSGALVPAYMIRAGDMVMFTNDIYALYFGSASEVGKRAVGFVVGTSYSAKNDEISLTIGNPDKAYEIIMSRLELTGGLK